MKSRFKTYHGRSEPARPGCCTDPDFRQGCRDRACAGEMEQKPFGIRSIHSEESR